MRKNNTQKKKSEIKVRLIIADFKCSHDMISSVLGLSPSKIWKEGDSGLHTKIKAKNNGWMLVTPPYQLHTSLDKQVNSLLKIIASRVDKFSKLPPNLYIALSCVIYDYERDVPLGFSKETIRILAQIGAEIDIDYYDLSE